MLGRLTRKAVKRLLATLAILAALVGILANWEAAVASLKKLVGWP